MTVSIFYRLANQPAAERKDKLQEASKEACLANCISVFGRNHLTVYGDRLNEETRRMVCTFGVNLIEVNEGSGGGNFRRAASDAMRLNDEHVVYMLEDDFLHLPRSTEAIHDGLSLGAAYVTLYDHPDKYLNAELGGNPHVQYGGEATRLLCGRACHWKVTNSTVMTFATTVRQLRSDWKIFLKFCPDRYTDDYKIFRTLGRKGRTLLSAVPGLATHCESKFLSPFTDWQTVASNSTADLQRVRGT